MKKSFLVVLSCVASVFIFQAFTVSTPPGFKNLQILPKDISKDGIDSVMHHFTASLGVKCNFCHVRNEAEKKMDFASDDKPEKQIARKMMLMSIDINTKYFKEIEEEMDKEADHKMDSNDVKLSTDSVKNMLSYVTCYTCHRGNERPVSDPPKEEPKTKAPVAPAQADKK
jgi:hypothetical protein